MKQADLVITNTAEIITVSGNGRPKRGKEMSNLEIIPRGAVACNRGRIVWVGPETDMDRYVSIEPDAVHVDAENGAILPGLVDCHTHLIFAGSRENEFAQKIAGVPYMEIAAAGGGIKSTVRATRAASVADLVAAGRQRIREGFSFGVTAHEIKSGYGLDTESELKILRAARDLRSEMNMELPRTFLGAHEIPPKTGRREYLDLVCEEMIPRVAREGLAEFCDVFCEKGVFSVEEARRVLNTGLLHGLSPKIHAEQLSNSGGTVLAAELNAVSADHLDYIDDDGIHALIRSGTIGVLLPGAVFFLGLNRYAPARKMIDSGMTIALSTDFNPGSCMSQNLPLIMTIACTQCRMTIQEAISACTLNAAFAAGRGTVCGSIEPGKRADLIILDTPAYSMIPYHFGHNHVRHVFCGGIPVVRNFCFQSFP
ncbi:imidazolonepropionase [bacterium]|nr:imidazolonepropionase [candidate division CSSED10-310 bacterium]